MVPEDVEGVREVLRSKQNTSWAKKMAFDFNYIASRVRRKVPPPAVLYHRMKAVFDFFKGKIDSKTNVVLFHEKNRKIFESVLNMVKKIYASDPLNVPMYFKKTNKYGRFMIDKDGLTLYRSV